MHGQQNIKILHIMFKEDFVISHCRSRYVFSPANTQKKFIITFNSQYVKYNSWILN